MENVLALLPWHRHAGQLADLYKYFEIEALHVCKGAQSMVKGGFLQSLSWRWLVESPAS